MTSMATAHVVQGSPLTNSASNVYDELDWGNPPVGHQHAAVQTHHYCADFGDLPPGYARFTRGGYVFHNPRHCPSSSDMDTDVSVLSEEEQDDGEDRV